MGHDQTRVTDWIGKRVRFAPNPRFPDRVVEATVIGRRADPRLPSLRSTQWSRGAGVGWLDTRDDAGVVRSARASRCEIVGRDAGELCARAGCLGTMEFPPVEGCSCHLHAPCGACVDNRLTCSECGVEI